MSEKRFIVFPNNVVWDNQLGEVVCRCILEGIGDAENVCQRLNELHEETQLLKCALALDAITNISLNDKKVDIPPYYEFENYQQLKKERREEYDEYW